MAKKKDDSAVVEENRALKKKIKKMNEPKGIANALTKEKTEIVIPDNVLIEREIRRYVKKSGGFRKNLPGDSLDRAKSLLGKAGRPYKKDEKPEWDVTVEVPGMIT
jgi:hypothetical protein